MRERGNGPRALVCVNNKQMDGVGPDVQDPQAHNTTLPPLPQQKGQWRPSRASPVRRCMFGTSGIAGGGMSESARGSVRVEQGPKRVRVYLRVVLAANARSP